MDNDKIEYKRKKRHGCRNVITFLILLAAGGAIFYFGWVQFRLDAGEYGIIYTKTHGWEEIPIVNGEFAWRWQGLIPTNLEVHIIKPVLRSITIEKSGILPSGKMYASILGGEEDFSWYMNVKINYILLPDKLATMLANDMSDFDSDTLYNDYELRINGHVSEFMRNLNSFSSLNQVEKNLYDYITSNITDFSVKSVVVTDLKYPDMELYARARQMTETYIQNREQILIELDEQRLRKNDEADTRMKLLSQIGEVLTDNPILLELFNLEGQPGTALLPNMIE